MGVNNRQRRAVRARQRAKQRAAQAPPRSRGVSEIADPGHMNRTSFTGAIDHEREIELHRIITIVWSNGWQPCELLRELARTSPTRTGRARPSVELLRRLIAVDHARRETSSLHPRWRAQIASLNLPAMQPDRGWLADELRTDPEVDEASSFLLRTLLSLGPLQRLIPPPGKGPGDVDIDLAGSTSVADDRDPVLGRVRALLAQAESTNFPAEADTFTAKAHALMTRHAIDAALLDSPTSTGGWTTALRIPIDDPYGDTKSWMLQIVAEHNRCRAVFHSRYAMSTVVGTSGDVIGVELLYTSLLLQAQRALLAAAADAGAGAVERSRGYRTSFLFAYANGIDTRLAAVTASVVDEASADEGTSLLPLLASRSKALDDEFDGLFGSMCTSRVQAGRNAAGWLSGRRAAQLADLGGPNVTGGHRAAAIRNEPDAGRFPLAS